MTRPFLVFPSDTLVCPKKKKQTGEGADFGWFSCVVRDMKPVEDKERRERERERE